MSTGTVGRRGSTDLGATVVEFALILPLLLLLTLGIFTTARAWNIHNVMDHAVREAARIGATSGDPALMELTARGELQAASIDWTSVQAPPTCFDPVDSGSAGTCIPAVDDPTLDDRVQARIMWPNYELNFLFFSMTVDLEAQAVARLEVGAGT